MAESKNKNRLFEAVKKLGMSSEDAQQKVDSMFSQSREKHPQDSESDHQERVADKIINQYSRLAGLSGGATALPGIIPGIGTAVATVGGASADVIACMKLEFDMCLCMAGVFRYDLGKADTRNLALLIAATGTVHKFAKGATTKLASKAGVHMVQRYLKGNILKVTKALFIKIGIRFTRKALVKFIPFGVGVVFGSGLNHAMTKYVGRQAKEYFIIEREDRTVFQRLIAWFRRILVGSKR